MTNWDNMPITLSVDETAKIIGYGKARIRELCRSKQIPNIHVGRAFRIPKDALRQWIGTECQMQKSISYTQ